MARRSGLGRGLEAILPTDVADDGAALLQDVPVDQIRPNRHQPRREFDEQELADLTASVEELGVLQPVLARRLGPDAFELIAGERRWRAARAAGLDVVPAIIRDVDEVASLEQAVVENVQRADLNPLEEAGAYQQLLQEFELTQEQVANRVGRSRSGVANAVRLLQLSPSLQAMVVEGTLSAGHARALLGTGDTSFQEGLANRIAASSLTVRQVEEAVRRHEATEPDDRDAAVPGDTKPAALLELERLLSDKLSTRVNVELGARKGRIEIEVADLADLERVFLLLS